VKQIWSIGHSRSTFSEVEKLLRATAISAVVDVRTYPSSKMAPEFNRRFLEQNFPKAGIKYFFLGRELGGRPDGDEFYDSDGRVDYRRLSESPIFEQGMTFLDNLTRDERVAVLCSEGKPEGCHRHLLIERASSEMGLEWLHILPDGIAVKLPPQEDSDMNTLFDWGDKKPWKSLLSVRRDEQPNHSSKH
jgi:uncharacterized protein (DUF488 family)